MRFISTSSAILAAILTASAVCPLAARADAQSDLSNAVQTTLKAPSYHMTIQTPASGTQEGDYVQ